MNLERYPVKADDDFRRFEFFSVGPKGRIKKVVQFQQLSKDGTYNLAFGDWDENSESINSNARTNNGDRDKVMGAVASAVFEFMLVHSKAAVYATGATKARTRLYQMGISKHLSEITFRYKIEGWLNDKWEPFERGKNYEAFALEKKSLI
jgi:hypothetical protein